MFGNRVYEVNAPDLRRSNRPPDAKSKPANSISSGSPPVLANSPVGEPRVVVAESVVIESPPVGSDAKAEPALVTALASEPPPPALDPPTLEPPLGPLMLEPLMRGSEEPEPIEEDEPDTAVGWAKAPDAVKARSASKES